MNHLDVLAFPRRSRPIISADGKKSVLMFNKVDSSKTRLLYSSTSAMEKCLTAIAFKTTSVDTVCMRYLTPELDV